MNFVCIRDNNYLAIAYIKPFFITAFIRLKRLSQILVNLPRFSWNLWSALNWALLNQSLIQQCQVKDRDRKTVVTLQPRFVNVEKVKLAAE
ncbi:hypothetical protein H6F50_11705 [Coleofasciculus sp. FACHB-712]|uniref:hypothetical protein n=1 Tax=Cyanophyceae TaxID=3028117 RepID=UPI001688D101|nr:MULTISPECIES: hypothetical protein [unclassified Coleofasciculus]MBD1838836.1 hypothetical protein [Coleofasciculus sp. FACHB-501]MBD1943017.1 hypothetical protein [Coleofasciculus sp. FACHB-712]